MTDRRHPGYPEYPTAPPSWPPAWHRDPEGRHEYRYWDGSRWTEQVYDRGVPSWDPMASRAAPAAARRRKSRKRLWLVLGVVLLLAAIGAALFAYLVSQVDGAGTFARELEEPGSTLVHTVRAEDDTVVLIRVSPSGGSFDPVIGVATDEATVDRLADFFATDGPLPDDVFPARCPRTPSCLRCRTRPSPARTSPRSSPRPSAATSRCS